MISFAYKKFSSNKNCNFNQNVLSRISRWGLFSGASALAIIFTVQDVYADCTPDPVEVNGSVICSGSDTDGFISTEDGISVSVIEGSDVTVANSRAILINAKNASFLNQGSITGNLDFGFDGLISLTGNGTIGINEGVILTSSSGSALSLNGGVSLFDNREGGIISSDGFRGAVNLDNSFNGKFINSGTISSANRTAVYAFTSSSSGSNNRIVITNNGTGVIEGETGIYNFGGDFLDITNHGVIRGNIGVSINENSILTNEETGIIEAARIADFEPLSALYSRAVGLNGKTIFINKGIVRSSGTAVLGGAYTLDNSGDITGDIVGNSDNQIIINTGTISGSLNLDLGMDLVENSSTITGNISLGGNADVFRDFGGTISGTVDLGDGDDILVHDPDSQRGTISGGINTGAGYDSFGVSIAGEKSVTLQNDAAFEGLAIETRTADSRATIENTGGYYSSTLSVFGSGTVINEADFTVSGQETVRLLSDTTPSYSTLEFEDGPFGRGVNLVNKGLITRTGSGSTTAILSIGDGHDRVENYGTITGDVDLAGGDDMFLSLGGNVSGNIQLGSGDDTFFYAPPSGYFEEEPHLDGFICICIKVVSVPLGGVDRVTGNIDGGNGFDAAGLYVKGTASGVLYSMDGFESAAVLVDGISSKFTISGTGGDIPLPILSLFGTGTVINNASIDSDLHGGFSSYENKSAVRLKSDGLRFENNGVISGFIGDGFNGSLQHTILILKQRRITTYVQVGPYG